jgi:hypothetical protein
MDLVAIVKDILVPVIAGLLLSSFTGAGLVAWWGIRRMVQGQDSMNLTLTAIREDLSEAIMRVGQLETREALRESMNQERHRENRFDITNLESAVVKLQQRRG